MSAKGEHAAEVQPLELYPLPDTWRWGTVSDAGADQKNAIVDGPFGSNLKLSDYVADGTVPVLTTKNLAGTYDDFRYISQKKFEELKRSAVYTGDILMAKIGSCGKTGIYSSKISPAMIPANLLKVSVSEKFERKYVFYYFNSPFFQKALKTIIKATAQPAFGVTNFRALPLPLAPLPLQREIVAEIEKQFSRLDEAVAGLKRIKANLKRYKAAVLKAAVEGKLTEEWRSRGGEAVPRPVSSDETLNRATHWIAPTNNIKYETGAELLKRILVERKKKWEEKNPGKKYNEPVAPDTSNLSQLPKGWVWATVEQLASLVTDGDHNPPKRIEDGVPHLTAKSVVSGRLIESGCTYISEGDFEKVRRRYEPLRDDVIITCVGTIGRTAIIPPGYLFSADRNLAAVRLVNDGMAPRILQINFDAPLSQKKIRGASGSTAQPHFYLADLRSFAVPLMSRIEQGTIIAEVDRLLSVAEEIETTVDAHLKRAERLRQGILKKAFSGDLLLD
ncbi:MAG: restriction endonuclease subunit S [Nitrospirae bacterium]|nr:restriction endonuclease subunit S [Nitrospirota bacterium]